ncbi:MAG: hypothetical protein HY854_09825 [Burkholderiales bacterium]|nr:hypothetical protein [Burkholderiales bacterium]
MAFQMTSAAAGEILAAAARSGAEGMGLRIAAKATGDGGLAFGMGFDEPAPQDQVLAFGALKVLIAASSAPWLDDVLLDFDEAGLGQGNFVFVPSEQAAAAGCATAAAGCGSGGCSRCG